MERIELPQDHLQDQGDRLLPSLRVTGGHPYFLPWLPFVKKLQGVDVFLATPSIPFTKHDNYVHRTRLNDFWLTVPTLRCSPDTKTMDVLIVPGSVPPLAKSLTTEFGKRYPARARLEPFIALLAGSTHRYLYDLTMDVLRLARIRIVEGKDSQLAYADKMGLQA